MDELLTSDEVLTEADFVAHITQTVNTAAKASWLFLCDQLNTHKSESLLQYVAESIGDTQYARRRKARLLSSRT